MANSELHHVVFCCSGQGGLLYLAAAVRSVFESHSEPDILRVHIIHQFLGQVDLDRLYLSWQPWSDEGQVSFYQMSDYLGEKALNPIYGYWFRAWMHKVLPEEIEKVLYLDYDLMVLRDVGPLWNIDLDEHMGAMAEEPDPVRARDELIRFAQGFDIPCDPEQTYFNSGVILVNMKRWRESDIGAVLDEHFAVHRPHDYLFDQGEINLLFGSEFLTLPPEYNVIHAPIYNVVHKEKLKTYALDPVILHFAGTEKVTKPWRRLGEKDKFYEVIDRTAWSGWRSENDKTLKGALVSQLLEYRHLVNNRDRLHGFWRKLARLLLRNPLLPLLQLMVPLARKLRGV